MSTNQDLIFRLQNQHKTKKSNEQQQQQQQQQQPIPAPTSPATAVITTTPAAAAAAVPLTIRHLKVDSPLLQEHKAAITIGIIMGIFLLCWYNKVNKIFARFVNVGLM